MTRPTVRLRLTAAYGALFLLGGVIAYATLEKALEGLSKEQLAELQKQLAKLQQKLAETMAAGKPTKVLDDKIYEVEDDLKLLAQK